MALYYWGMQLQIDRRLIVVSSRWSWVADGGGILRWGMQLQIARLYNGGLKVVMGGRWWRCIIGECNCRLLDAF